MKLLIIGSSGQLGHDFVDRANAAGHIVNPVDYPLIDLLDKASVDACVNEARPDAIVNCAAFTAVDDCETMRDEAFGLNAEACGFLAEAAKRHKALLVHFSTDYVFDGQSSTPYTESCRTNPQSVYGQSKLGGEKIITDMYDNVMIFRIAWLYGLHGSNFVKTIRWLAVSRAKEKKSLKIVNDQFGSPTWTVSVCKQVLAMLDRPERGIFHCTSEGFCTWYDFAKEIATAFGINASIEPCATAEFPRPAPRPKYSVLENARFKEMGVNIMPDWRDAFKDFLSMKK